MTYGWNQAANKAKELGEVNGERTVEIGWRYIATLHADGSVTYREKHRIDTDPRATLPNMEVTDGEIRIPLTDLVGEALKRLEPKDLAVALWDNEEVRAEFMDVLVTRYNQQGIEDADRRKFLEGVKEAVHSKELDVLAAKMALLEYALSKRSYFYHEVNSVNERLHEAGYVDKEGNPIRLRHEDNDPDFKIAGKHWNEGREFWRAEVLKQFPFAKSGAA
jgi:hypothetical protein